MKKQILLAGVLSCLIFGSASVEAATFQQADQPKETTTVTFKNGDTWERNVGDGIDTYEYQNGKWTPKSSTSLRRKDAYYKEVIIPNQKAIAEKETEIQKYVEKIKSSEAVRELFNLLPDEKAMVFKYVDGEDYRIPKVDVPAVISAIPNYFYQNETTVPETLEILLVKESGSSATETKSSESSTTESTTAGSTFEKTMNSASSSEIIQIEPKTNEQQETADEAKTDEKENPASPAQRTNTNQTADTISAESRQYDVDSNKSLNREELLSLVTYKDSTGNDLDKSPIVITIKSDYVYVVDGRDVYHNDLYALLGTATNPISVMTPQEAETKNLRKAQGVSDKGIQNISLKLPGKYQVTYTVGNLTATNTITVDGDEKSTGSSNTTKSSSSTTKKSYPSSTRSSSSSAKQYPKTGAETSTQYAWIGAGIFAAAAAFLFKKKQ